MNIHYGWSTTKQTVILPIVRSYTGPQFLCVWHSSNFLRLFYFKSRPVDILYNTFSALKHFKLGQHLYYTFIQVSIKIIPTMFLTTIHHKKHSWTNSPLFSSANYNIYYTVIFTSSFFSAGNIFSMKLLLRTSDEHIRWAAKFNKLYECHSNHLQLRANSHPTLAYKLRAT